ncbi:GntR family transcriptional regulator [Thermoanaerobacteraceae bacterium SP2]|nr:GntR family transcriptional regulator [Thermoanaerobacteraceae bacterium SP2]
MSETLSDKAYNIIKEKLIYAEKGSYLSIREYADKLEMSYTPVREAFLRLHKEGLLELVPKVGFFTTRMDLNEILQIFQVRECVEIFVFKKVFNMITDEHIKMLEKCVEEQRHGLKTNNIREYIDADEKFHGVFIDIYNNQYLTKLYKNIREQYLICSNKIAESHSEVAIEEHMQIIQHIKCKDLEKAVSTLNSHIENAWHRMKDGYIRV